MDFTLLKGHHRWEFMLVSVLISNHLYSQPSLSKNLVLMRRRSFPVRTKDRLTRLGSVRDVCFSDWVVSRWTAAGNPTSTKGWCLSRGSEYYTSNGGRRFCPEFPMLKQRMRISPLVWFIPTIGRKSVGRKSIINPRNTMTNTVVKMSSNERCSNILEHFNLYCIVKVKFIF